MASHARRFAVPVVFVIATVHAWAQQPIWMNSFQTAMAELRAGHLENVLARFDELGKRYKADTQLLTSIGAALDSTSHHREATPWYQRSLAINPHYGPALNDLGQNYVALGDFAAAAPVFEMEIHTDPSNWRAAYNLGLVELRLKRYSDAAGVFGRAAKLATDAAVVEQCRIGEATALLNAKRYRAAAAVLTPYGDAPNLSHLLLMGTAEALAGDLPKAIEVLQHAIERFPNDDYAYYRLALVFSLGRRDQEAQDVLATGLKIAPHSPLLLYGEAVIAESMGVYDDAVRLCKESILQKAEQPDAWGLLGSAYVRIGKLDEAAGAFERALHYGAETHVRVNYAECLLRMDRTDEAAAQLRELQRQEPENAEVLRGLGKLYRARGEFAKAEPVLQRAVQLDPNDSEAHFVLAETLRHLGRVQAAKKEYAEFQRTKSASRMVRQLELASRPSD
jgi:tetratricopeptide (TPR) repeat protein